MEQYSQYSKEELIHIIRELEAKVEKSSANRDNTIDNNQEHRHYQESYSSRILNALPDMLSILDRNGVYVDLVSSEETVHVGGSSANIIGKNIVDFLPEEAYINVKANLDKVFRTGLSSCAHHTLDVNGSPHHFENRIFPLDKDNALCMCRDVTDAVNIQEELEVANRKIRSVENMASLGQWYYYSETQEFKAMQVISSILEKEGIFSISRDEYFSMVYPEDREKLQERLTKAEIREEKLEHRITINGKTKYLHTKTSNVFEKDGCQIIEGYIHDVTSLVERRQQLEAMVAENVSQQDTIKELNFIMDTILNNVPVYLFMKDTGNEFRYSYWNKAFEEHSHIPASFVMGKTDFEVFPNPKDAQKFREDDLRLLKLGSKIEFQEEYTTAHGEIRVVNTLKTLVPSANKPPLIIGVSWDITNLKNTENELIQARIKAEESDKLKSAFLANMSHEIRTPLNAIVGFSKLIAESEDPTECRQYTDIVDTNADILLQLINDILDLSKIEAGTLEFIDRAIDLKETCQHLYEVHLPRTPKYVKLVFDKSSPALTTICDSNRLAQVISNLLTNAQKFTKQGEIRFGYELSGDNIHFYVKDTGIGISQGQLPTIFNRFTKLNNFAQGSGLGLAICKMIVETMGGQIHVESIKNEGSTFHFTLPYRPDKKTVAETSDREISKTEQPAKELKKILIAEDVDSNFLLVKALLIKDYKILRACNGKEAVQLFEENTPDLILMDIKMPEMDGLEATRVIRKKSAAIPIIALTAFAFEMDKIAAENAGCNSFLTKPVSPEKLKETLGRYL